VAKARYSATILVEDRLVKIHQVDLVHRQDDVADAEQRGDDRVTARLREHALTGIDQHDGKIGCRSARRHVAGVLHMARRVGDDKLALRRRKEPVGDIDGDALLALGLQAIDQQREIELFAGRTVRAVSR
jgi:hypothetical protein